MRVREVWLTIGSRMPPAGLRGKPLIDAGWTRFPEEGQHRSRDDVRDRKILKHGDLVPEAQLPLLEAGELQLIR